MSSLFAPCYSFDTDVEDHVLDWHLGGIFVEHVKYDNALMQQVMEYDKNSLVNLLPPLAADD